MRKIEGNIKELSSPTRSGIQWIPAFARMTVVLFLLVMPAGTVRAVPGEVADSPFHNQANPFTQSPQRIVSINLCTDELLVRLADKERIAALMHYSSKPESSTIFEQVKDIPKLKRGEIEEVLAHNPDIVFAGTFSNVDTVNFLKKLNIPVVIFEVAQDFQGIYSNIKRMAKILDEEFKGDELVEDMQMRLRNIKHVPEDDKKKILFYQSGGNVPGANTFQHGVIELAGAKNAAAQMGIDGHAHVDLENLLFGDIDGLIFLDIHHKRESVGRELLFHPALKEGLPNVENFTLPSKLLNCGSPASVEAVELLAEQLEEKR